MKKVLIIDDDAMVRATLRDMLEEIGCLVCEADDGLDGIRQLSGFTPDIVITDILMPNKEGIETIAEIHRSRPDCPIIAISGGGSAGNMTFLQFAKKFGADQILEKPIRFRELETAVSQALSGQQ